MKRNQPLARACFITALIAIASTGCDSYSFPEEVKFNQTQPKRISKTVQVGNLFNIIDEYDYDAKGRLTSITQDLGIGKRTYHFEYNGDNRVSRITASGDLTTSHFVKPALIRSHTVIDVSYQATNDLPAKFIFNEEPKHSLTFTYKPSGKLEKSDYRHQSDTVNSGIDNIVYNPYAGLPFNVISTFYSYNEPGMVSVEETVLYVDNCPSEESPCHQENQEKIQTFSYYNYQTIAGNTVFAVIDQPGPIQNITLAENSARPVIHQSTHGYMEITYEEAECREVFPSGFRMPGVYELSPCAE